MKSLDNIIYGKIDYRTYRRRIEELLNNPELKKIGLQYNLLGYTEYNYPVETISIGYGDKDIFIVGGTHGSEIIGVDFILQLINNIGNFSEFDPNIYKITFMPIQNPEGFDITTSTYKNIVNEENFTEKSFEYYERYRIDSLISIAMNSFNLLINDLINSNELLTPSILFERIKEYFNTNPDWKRLCEKRALPLLENIKKYLNNISNINNFEEFKIIMLHVCDSIIDKLMSDKKSYYTRVFLNEFKTGFNNSELWQEIDKKNRIKLYQEMFKNDNFENITNKELSNQVSDLYKKNNHPTGSQIAYDANGSGINLNANNILNPGIEVLKQKKIKYGYGTRDNIVRYFKGPIGSPTKDIDNFKYEKENTYLYKLLQESKENDRYLCTLLYHGTGGSIFYKPNELLMSDENKYYEYYLYNKMLASLYSLETNYEMLNISDTTGYGDQLRKTFKGVLLIELSKMGGNPIGPYGDKDNIYNTIKDNMNGIKSILRYFNKELVTKKIK